MAKIENEDDKLVTFSKRRSGISKKVSELITLCGAEIGILVFSPAGKPFSFGHPSLKSIVNHFLDKTNLPPKDNTHPLVEAHRMMRINELSQQYNEIVNKLKAEKERGELLKRMIGGKENYSNNWWNAPIEERNVDELKKTYTMFEELHTNLCKKIAENSIDGASSSSSSPALNDNLPNPTRLMMKNPIIASYPSGYGSRSMH